MGKKMWVVGGALALMLGMVAPVKASEGVVELDNVMGEPARCFAASVLMTNGSYSVIMSCRDLVYPIGSDVFKYTVWVVPSSGKKPYVVADLGVGKIQFGVGEPFSQLYVTRQSNGPGKKQDIVVMQGNMSSIRFLQTGEVGQVGPTKAPTPTSEPKTAGPSTASKLASSLSIGNWIGKIVGVMLVLGMAGLAVVIIASSWGGRRKNPPEI